MKKRLFFLPLAVAVLFIGVSGAQAQSSNPIQDAFEQGEDFSVHQTGVTSDGVPEYSSQTPAPASNTVTPAATTNTNTGAAANIQGFFQMVLDIINLWLIPVIFAIAILFFLYGVAKYFIIGRGNEEAVQEGQKFVMWSIIAFVIMFSVWGIINLVMGTFALNNSTKPQIPTFGSGTSATTNASPSTVAPLVAPTNTNTQSSTFVNDLY